MKPTPPASSTSPPTQLMGAIAPALAARLSARPAASLTGLLLTFAAQEYERGADIRAKENADMRALFAELGPHVTRRRAARETRPRGDPQRRSLTISALDAANADLRGLLIALHVHISIRRKARIWRCS